MANKKWKADHRADTRGEGLIGLPKCVYGSAAYRDLDLYARAVLMEILSRFNGYNNSEIGISYREIGEGLGNQNFARIAQAVADLMEHGLVDIGHEAVWKERHSRQYRLTWIMSGKPPFTAKATNDYLDWSKKIGVDNVSADGNGTADHVSASGNMSAEALSAVKQAKAQKPVKSVSANLLTTSQRLYNSHPKAGKTRRKPPANARDPIAGGSSAWWGEASLLPSRAHLIGMAAIVLGREKWGVAA
ncbi:hypothetical protein EKN06_12415 [Croceicoccus ponticola]|uniref:Helix-turn-helix domain-containing protein n=1 Tax=Croceicoccus ponticola TaxID=2217664 RepID=A0A437GVD0_9SPHN|nr:hypothetical protein [Croceicoccus ponticola]RVQ65732.1 hypothetical protein EKN06_12415 [Croceicoccus ponticola]